MTLLGRRIAILAGAAVLLIGLVALFVTERKDTAPAGPAPPPAEAGPPAPTTEEITIQKGQTISDILAGYRFSTEEIHRLIQQVKPLFKLDKIVAGRRLRLTLDGGGNVRAIEYLIDEKSYLVVAREGSDFKAEKKSYAFETKLAYIWGMIEDNPINAVSRRGENDALTIRMTDLFAWDIDFYTELRRGDAFRMVYEKKYLEGKFYRYGEILAAEFICQNKAYEAFRFEYPGTKKADYFDLEGKSVRKEFLRSPLPYGAPITSRFSYNRLHPIRKIYTAHYGIDYGAPVGMPVHATADGVVVSAGLNGAAGNMVHLKHKNGYETMYLHLARIFVKARDQVAGGKIIGTVGNSGESTGPHLDYRVKQGGSYVNPLSWKFLPAEPLRAEFKEEFKKRVEVGRLMLDAPLVLRRILSR
ncbi:MAG: peptidoglycan DD-metalloendopeptidase family protein [Candidatus Aminicenantes bacterium]|nr:peptidoglycan DD-metalloendopeptidase family protein [Candidatus Aminicenantes bacterium]